MAESDSGVRRSAKDCTKLQDFVDQTMPPKRLTTDASSRTRGRGASLPACSSRSILAPALEQEGTLFVLSLRHGPPDVPRAARPPRRDPDTRGRRRDALRER